VTFVDNHFMAWAINIELGLANRRMVGYCRDT